MKTSITVSIDTEVDYEKQIFDYVMSKGKRKKSGFIKQVLYDRMISEKGVKSIPVVTVVEDDEEEKSSDFDGFI